MSNCALCKHRQALYLNCLAFPWGIPMDVIKGIVIHDSVIKGQRGNFKYELHPLYNCPSHKAKAEKRYEAALRLASPVPAMVHE